MLAGGPSAISGSSEVRISEMTPDRDTRGQDLPASFGMVGRSNRQAFNLLSHSHPLEMFLEVPSVPRIEILRTCLKENGVGIWRFFAIPELVSRS